MPRIDSVEVQDGFKLFIRFRNGECVIYDVNEDIETIDDFSVLKTEPHLFEDVQIDESRTCIYWNDRVDLPSDALLEYGKRITDNQNLQHKKENVFRIWKQTLIISY
jgi:hypothetical protein